MARWMISSEENKLGNILDIINHQEENVKKLSAVTQFGENYSRWGSQGRSFT